MKRSDDYEPKKLIREAALLGKVGVEEVRWFSFPERFSSTSGPHQGIGGQALTTFQVYGFVTPGGNFLYCDGLWKDWDNYPIQTFFRR